MKEVVVCVPGGQGSAGMWAITVPLQACIGSYCYDVNCSSRQKTNKRIFVVYFIYV